MSDDFFYEYFMVGLAIGMAACAIYIIWKVAIQ